MTRVLIASREPRREWTKALRDSGFEIVGYADKAKDLLRLDSTAKPHIVVHDLQVEGAEVTRLLLQARPAPQVLVVFGPDERAEVVAAVKAGAAGCLPRSVTTEVFLDAVRRVVGGEVVFTPELPASVLAEIRLRANELALTERELEVLRLLTSGLSYAEIARELALPRRMVRNDVDTTLARLQLPSRTEVGSAGSAHGWAGPFDEADLWRVDRPSTVTVASPRHQLSIQIYLQDGARSAEVEQAVRDLLDIAGFEIESSEPPVIGSWLRKLFGRSKEVLTSEELADKMTLLQRALELKALDKPQSEVDSATVDAVAKLIEALSGETNATIQLGSVFLLKVDGSLAVRNLSQHELAFLRGNSGLFSSPRRLLDALDSREPEAQLCISPLRGMQSSVKDDEILARINELVDEEHSLRSKLRAGEVSAEDEHERVKQLEVTLDQCWDLLRQRRALRDANADPDQAKARPVSEVEGYQQ